ncbi:hypothetical protein NFX46_39285 [Streptomyces phaeoluteigriseus]|uniref:Uncharacterized protein n=1 Tax=Streptomyces phaeoluteigriseus TaxID=114686 RepID=A0ABY4ZK32_9ACTN|nr:hypothetical protein [Streptomyces phaeoluteigriseus]USQ89254.1 hypothetical protein NFX46_39285 [Streptomyces phaeoluteigriseus]
MRFRTSPSPAVADMKNRSSDDLRREYDLITRERDGGHNALSAINAQNDIARELESRDR